METKRIQLISRFTGLLAFALLACAMLIRTSAKADIYEPEGLNMPGAWNGWTNPPTNALSLASYTQVSGGRVTKITAGTPRWQTIFSVAASGGDLVGGTYGWLFTSGPTSGPWGNKWGGVTVAMNTLQNYTKGGADNSITIVNGKWYTMNWQDNGYVNTQAIYMVTSAAPVAISGVTVPATAVANSPVLVTVTLAGLKSGEEIIYLRYSTDNWLTSNILTVPISGTSGTVTIPGQPDGTTVKCYAFSSTVSNISSNYDMYTIKLNNNGGSYYQYSVGAAPITWANLQSPATASINPGSTVDVFAQVYIAGSTGLTTPAAGVQGWIGYSTTNTDPSTWSNWVAATYTGPVSTNDQYKGVLGAGLAPGTYFYASRFQLNASAYVYGGYNGGYWNGTTNISGILTVNGAAPAVSTGSVSNIAATTVDVSGTVIGDGGATVTARGICWSTVHDPTIADNITVNGTGVGSFTGNLTSLVPGTTYYARAYATNANGTSYGAEVEFATLYAVTFNVDMSTANGFIPGTDIVYLAGSFPGATWNTPGSNPAMALSRVATSLTYTLTLYLPAGTYEFKHFKNAGWGGGEWTGGSNRTVTVTNSTTMNNTWAGELNWANLQSPANGVILPSSSFVVYARAFIPNGITGVSGGAYGLQCWIGYSSSNTDPSGWTDWVPAGYSGIAGNNDEFKADIGALISTNGTYYYASRFKLGEGTYVYGGYSSGFWDGTTNVSGTLSVVNGFVLTVTTGSVSAVSATSANVSGSVLADGGQPVTARGICWSTSPNPTLANSFSVDGSGLGDFTGTCTPLTPGVTYYAKAYATNASGTVYGTEVSFTTNYVVTFNLDMGTASGFVPGTDQVYLAGGFPSSFWQAPGDNPSMQMTLSSGLIYTLTLSMPAGTYDFKYFLNPGWGGGEWTGGTNRSITVSSSTTINSVWGGEINWANLQWPDAGTIDLGGAYTVYAQAFIPNGRTGNVGGAYGLQAWIGYSSSNTDPATWTHWVPASYFGVAGSNDEFTADLGAAISTTGTYYYASRFQVGSAPYVYGGYSGGYWDGTTNVSGVLTVNEPITSKTLSVKVFLEGFYAGSGLMFKAKDENGNDMFPGTVADTVSVELHNASSYSVIEYQTHGVALNTNGDIQLTGLNGIPSIHSAAYFITIKHRNSVETTSAVPLSFATGSVSYDFSTAASQAYGANLQNLGDAFGIFAGDENKDGLVDSSDMIDADNDAAAFAVGYIPTDINGDGLTDSSDMILIDNNSTAFVASVLPF